MTDTSLWVFGYGSLMWNPGFAYDERAIATLPGYARSFCMRSIHHRGTEADPGLVLALDEHPDNPFLADKLLELRGQQLEFMRDMHRLEQNNRRET